MLKKKMILGEIWMVNLPENNGYCLHGKHPCLVIRQFGYTIQVIPISENRDNIHFSEIPIKEGKYNLRKKSKLKLGQYTSVTIENFINKIGEVDSEILIEIGDFILKDIVNFILKAA